MEARFARVSALALGWAVVVRAFDAAYHFVRTYSAVPADSLLHYHWILTWWRHGDSIRGFTLTPSPYFIDLLIQLPLALLAPDFERFSYALACSFALLISGSLFAVVRIALGNTSVAAAIATALAVAAFYTLAPFGLVIHAFMYNHTSEVFSTLGLLAITHAWYRPGATRRWTAYAYALLVAICVASSPFFIATYCVPVAIAAVAALGTPLVTRKRFAWLLVLTAIGTLVGLVSLALISRYAWPIRGDRYLVTPRESAALFLDTLATYPHLATITVMTVVAATAAGVLAVAARRRLPPPAIFMLAFLPASLAACTLLPLARGALSGAYELRYLQLPWLLACGFYAGIAVWLVRAVKLPRLPRWAAGAPAVVAILVVATMRGPLTMSDPESTTSGMLACVEAAERTAGLRDGIGAVAFARYVNAGRHGWDSPYVVVQVLSAAPPIVDARENDVVWFKAPRDVNFVATLGLDADALGSIQTRVGAPDRTITCSTPIDHRPDGKPTFDLWIWDRPDARHRLADMIAHDNQRSPFVPVIGADHLAIDLDWGDQGEGTLIAGHRIWRSGEQRAGAEVVHARSFPVPSGRYQIDVDLTAVPATDAPVAELVVMEETHLLRRYAIPAGVTHATTKVRVKNVGGPTSGDLLSIVIYARAATAIDVSALTLTLEKQRGIDPFRIFH